MEVLQRLAIFGDAAQRLAKEADEFSEVRVYDDGFSNRAIACPAKLVDEVAEVVQVGLLFINRLVHDRQLDLAQNGCSHEAGIDQEVAVAGVQPVLDSIDAQLRVGTQAQPDLLHLG